MPFIYEVLGDEGFILELLSDVPLTGKAGVMTSLVALGLSPGIRFCVGVLLD